MWRLQGDRIVNEKGKCIQVQSDYDTENRNVIVLPRRAVTARSGAGQTWEILYVDSAKPEPTKGLNPDFGLYINRPFYIVSHMPSKRYVDLIGSELVIKTRNGRKTQQFIFDQRTRTIKTMNNRGQSLDIISNGGSNRVRMYHTNSRWW